MESKEIWICSACGSKLGGLSLFSLGEVDCNLCGDCSENAEERWGSPEWGGVDWLERLGWPFYDKEIPNELKEFLHI